ncbi:hypothetical protein [Caulobacter phage Cr30]|uniref:hypothetical protein n=1 Tax=Caulobacter phage Cr30 TaxID=1357714 RepID=UPI0004A9B98B|nr:hypothetical protein OZ74_gp098 [Caulobacter phage Cr30]AGS80983.1 hypothetical protein [Caulobacter phage Cr30]
MSVNVYPFVLQDSIEYYCDHISENEMNGRNPILQSKYIRLYESLQFLRDEINIVGSDHQFLKILEENIWKANQ